ncbi:MAG: hypothetical protein GY759_07715 [Chloroflexi bacterium]|nr:hypothetical protein [Chloroflexota bacterium]
MTPPDASPSSKWDRKNIWLFLAAVITLAFVYAMATDALPALRGPGKWPPSWRWLYRPLETENLQRQLLHGLLLIAYLACTAWLLHPKPRRGRRHAVVVVGVAVAFLFVWQLSQIWIREQSLLDTLIFRVYAPPINGYFVAPAQVESVSYVLNHYAESIPTFFAHKQQTHPPGLFIFYALFGALFERLPGLSSWFAELARTWALDIREWPLLMDHLITSAFATAWVQLIFVSLTPLSLYAFANQLSLKEDNNEWALWSTLALPLIAPLTLFVLQWDTNYPAIGFAAWFFAVRGQNRLRNATYHRRGQWFDWLWAGLLLCLLTWLSFGMAVFALLIGIHILWREAVRLPWHAGVANLFTAFRPTLIGLVLMAAGVLLPWLLAYLFWGMNFFELLQIGMGYHYSLVTANRNYRIWAWMNLVDFTLWLGPALLLLGITGTIWLLQRIRSGSELVQDVAGMAISFWLMLLVLNFSGSTRGEIGRLWIFLMPFPMLFALIPPWRYYQRLIILILMALVTWVLGYAIAPLDCC